MTRPRVRIGTPDWIRILAYTDRSTECWIWQGSGNQHGYGQLRLRGALHQAHRIAYAAWIGAIPEGLELDHLCRNRACVRPDHLEPVTHEENVRRGQGGRPRRTHCLRGHAYSRWTGKQNVCDTCRAVRQRAPQEAGVA